MVRFVLIALAGLAVMAPAAAAASPAPYRTDAQAARYVGHVRHGVAYCVNGYYSRTEQRTGHHFPQHGQRFRSFACSLTSTRTGATSSLYVRTLPGGGWSIRRDR